MKPFLYILLAYLTCIQALPSAFPEEQAKYDQYRIEATAAQRAILEKRDSGCNWNNVIIRREWWVVTLAV